MGAYEKDLIAAGGKPRRLNMLDDADVSDSESDFEEPITPGRNGRIQMLKTQQPPVTTIDEPPTPVTIDAQHLCRPVASTSTCNAFQTLAENHHSRAWRFPKVGVQAFDDGHSTSKTVPC